MELHVSSLFFDKVPDFGVELVARIFEASVADSFEGYAWTDILTMI